MKSETCQRQYVNGLMMKQNKQRIIFCIQNVYIQKHVQYKYLLKILVQVMKHSKETLYLMGNWGNTKQDFYQKEQCRVYIQGKKRLRENAGVGLQTMICLTINMMQLKEQQLISKVQRCMYLESFKNSMFRFQADANIFNPDNMFKVILLKLKEQAVSQSFKTVIPKILV